MTETMLDRMAKAIALSDGYTIEQLNQYRDEPRVCPMPEYRANARAALQAIREVDATTVGAVFSFPDQPEAKKAARDFTAMIDVILKEKS
jgi:hypothetical protein